MGLLSFFKNIFGRQSSAEDKRKKPFLQPATGTPIADDINAANQRRQKQEEENSFLLSPWDVAGAAYIAESVDQVGEAAPAEAGTQASDSFSFDADTSFDGFDGGDFGGGGSSDDY